jgi:predicted acetyltransferase
MRTVAPGIFDRVRHGHAGQISRRDSSWDRRLDLVETPWRDTSHALRCALYAGSSGEPEGYLLYRVDGDWQHGVPTARLAINELMALTGEAYLGLWRYAAEVDLVGELSADMRPVDEGLPWLLDNARKALQQTVRGDFLWLRSLDTPRLLAERRYCTEGQVILQIDDPLDLAGGRFAVEGSPDGATCRATSASPDLTLSMRALGAIALGGAPLSVLQHVGEVQEERPGAVVRAERMFHEPRAPWCSTFF